MSSDLSYHNEYISLAVVVKVAHQAWYVSKTTAVGEVQVLVHIVNVIPLGILYMKVDTCINALFIYV